MDKAAELADAGMDKIIVRMETPFSVGHLEAVADALRASGLVEPAPAPTEHA